MKHDNFDTHFSVVCLPDKPHLFMMNMQVFRVEAATVGNKPDAIVWCAVYHHPVAHPSAGQGL